MHRADYVLLNTLSFLYFQTDLSRTELQPDFTDKTCCFKSIWGCNVGALSTLMLCILQLESKTLRVFSFAALSV